MASGSGTSAIEAKLSRLDSLLATDVQSYLPYDLLVKMDIETMACSLEARSPLLDHETHGIRRALPDQFKLRGGRSKYLLRKVARKLLPARNLDRRRWDSVFPWATG